MVPLYQLPQIILLRFHRRDSPFVLLCGAELVLEFLDLALRRGQEGLVLLLDALERLSLLLEPPIRILGGRLRLREGILRVAFASRDACGWSDCACAFKSRELLVHGRQSLVLGLIFFPQQIVGVGQPFQRRLRT